MTLPVCSAFFILLGATIIIILERTIPYDRGQPFFRSGFWNDLLFYTIIQSYILGILIQTIIVWIDHGTGLTRLNLVSHCPIWMQFIFFLITHDLYIYCFHRLQHRYEFLWRIHEAHHSTQHVDWLAGMRSHSLEILINQSIEFAPIVLLGAAPETVLIKITIDAIWGMYIHSNVNVKTGILQYILNGPEMHRWHHAIDITEGGINFGTKFAFWDWIFRTAYHPKTKPSGYGLSGISFPQNYFAQQIFAFRNQ